MAADDPSGREKAFRFDLREASGALGDLGTLLPLSLGAIAMGGLAPTPVLLGFAVAYVGTALVYRRPVPVQPMKAVAAVLLAGGAGAASVAASGVMIGAALLLLAATGWTDRVARAVPRSVLAGLQLGLGVSLGLIALDLMATAPLAGMATAALLLALSHVERVPAALVALAAAVWAGAAFDLPTPPAPPDGGPWLALPAAPSWDEVGTALGVLALPQIALTLTNAVALTALLAGDLFGRRARAATPRRLAATTGLGNLVLAPFGALPMCHGAGGLAAHARFGARSGGAPLMLGLALGALALAPGGAALLASVPSAALGALLLFAAVELGASRRLTDALPSCAPVIAVTAGATLLLDPFWGLLSGCVVETARKELVRRLRRGRTR